MGLWSHGDDGEDVKEGVGMVGMALEVARPGFEQPKNGSSPDSRVCRCLCLCLILQRLHRLRLSIELDPSAALWAPR